MAGEVVEAQATVQRLMAITPPVSTLAKEATKTEGITGESTADRVLADTLPHTVGTWNGNVEVSFVVCG